MSNFLSRRLPKTGTTRLEAFSDGVFAIALTLLILEIKVPKHEQIVEAGSLFKYLIGIWPSYFSYVTSGVFIGIYWINHHWLFSFVKKTDHIFNMLNVFFLVTISFMPFTTAVFGDFLLEKEFMATATTVYAIGFLLPVLPVSILGHYAFYKNRLVDPHLKKEFMNRQLVKLYSSFLLNCFSVLISFYYPYITICIIILTFLMFLLPPDPPVYYENPGLAEKD